MHIRWNTPFYRFSSLLHKEIWIDVTTSVSPGLPPNKVVRERLVPFFRQRRVSSILDFGAGALRHCFPLLEAGFEVCAVDFEEGFARPTCRKALQEAQRYAGFSALIWPKDFIRDRHRFDAALLFYVLQTMPRPDERGLVLEQLYRKLRNDSYLVYASRYGQVTSDDAKHRVSDGYYKWPERHYHSFYREFTTADTHAMLEAYRFRRIRSLGERGSDQIFVYVKGNATWI